MNINDVRLLSFSNVQNMLGKQIELSRGGVNSHLKFAVFFILMRRREVLYGEPTLTENQSLY